MSGSGFQVIYPKGAGMGAMQAVLSLASTTYKRGAAIDIEPASGNSGIANKVVAAGTATHIVEAMVLPDASSAPAAPAAGTALGASFTTTALQEKLLCVPILGGEVNLKSYLTGDAVPPINGTACNANATLTVALVTAAGSTGDYTDGTIYIPEIGEQRLITDDTVGGGVHTFTVAPAFRRAPTTGDTAIVVPFTKGALAVKFNATSPSECIGTAVADKSGGALRIEEVDLKGDNFGPFVIVSIPATS